MGDTATLSEMEILHLTRQADWDHALARGTYRISSLGATLEQEGFIHASTEIQLPTVAAAFYAEVPDPLVVLRMDEEAIRAAGIEVRYEDGGAGEFYPHIYGAIPTDLVISVTPAHFDHEGRFSF